MEGCGFRDLQDKFTEQGVHIVGVSYGKPERAAKWAAKQEYGFEVWSDTNKALGNALGAGDGAVAKRITVILDAKGVPRVVYPSVSVGAHPEDVLHDVIKLKDTLHGS